MAARTPGPRRGASRQKRAPAKAARVSPESVNIYQAKARLSALVERAAAGEEIIIAKDGKPRARLVPLPTPRVERKPGGWEDQLWIAPDFNDPLPPELQAAFET